MSYVLPPLLHFHSRTIAPQTINNHILFQNLSLFSTLILAEVAALIFCLPSSKSICESSHWFQILIALNTYDNVMSPRCQS